MESQGEPRSSDTFHSISWNSNLEWNSNVWSTVFTLLMLTIYIFSILKEFSKIMCFWGSKKTSFIISMLYYFLIPFFPIFPTVLHFPSHSKWPYHPIISKWPPKNTRSTLEQQRWFSFCLDSIPRKLWPSQPSTVCSCLSLAPIFLSWPAIPQGPCCGDASQEGLELPGSRQSCSKTSFSSSWSWCKIAPGPISFGCPELQACALFNLPHARDHLLAPEL